MSYPLINRFDLPTKNGALAQLILPQGMTVEEIELAQRLLAAHGKHFPPPPKAAHA